MGGSLLSWIELENFRNHRRWQTPVSPGLTVLVGANAAGKTNILEAVAVLVTGRSFRQFAWGDLVREGEAEARVRVGGEVEGVPLEAGLVVEREGAKKHLLDGRETKVSSLSQRIPIVTFVPEDLQLSKGSSEERRSAVDQVGERLSQAYARTRKEYARVVRQRNHLLRNRASAEAIEPWTSHLAQAGAALVVQRAKLLRRMEPELLASHRMMGRGESLDIALSATWSDDIMSVGEVAGMSRETVADLILRSARNVSEDEARRGFSLAGPHRDDIVFRVEGRDARGFASQGQHRTLALAWKASEVSVVEHVTGRRPLLLLDDVMSELDDTRREALAREVIAKGQALLTTTTLEYLTDRTIEEALIAQL